MAPPKTLDTPSPRTSKNAYATLLTRPSYLAGVVLLAYSLQIHSPSTPLIILYTPETLPQPCITALEKETKHVNTILRPVEHLRVPEANAQEGIEQDRGKGMVAERFKDTWTKLRVFEIGQQGEGGEAEWERICFLDADMLVFRDPSPLIFSAENDTYLVGSSKNSSGNGQEKKKEKENRDEQGCKVMATHVCVCNLDADPWAPPTWTASNCAFTHLTSPNQIPAVHPSSDTLSIFNTGTFLFRPSPAISSLVLSAFLTTAPSTLHALQFPDQDFLNRVFRGKWKSLSWKTNALKTWRYWHPNIWRHDDDVAILHYIVDKPWAARVEEDRNAEGGLRAGYLGKDGVTHSWWWNVFGEWRKEREKQGEGEVLGMVGRYVVGGKGHEEMRAIGGGAQDFAKEWEGRGTDGIVVEA